MGKNKNSQKKAAAKKRQAAQQQQPATSSTTVGMLQAATDAAATAKDEQQKASLAKTVNAQQDQSMRNGDKPIMTASGSTIISKQNLRPADLKGKLSKMDSDNKPFMMAAHRTLRPDENPIDIIKEFLKQQGSNFQYTDGKRCHETSTVSIYTGGKKIRTKTISDRTTIPEEVELATQGLIGGQLSVDKLQVSGELVAVPDRKSLLTQSSVLKYLKKSVEMEKTNSKAPAPAKPKDYYVHPNEDKERSGCFLWLNRMHCNHQPQFHDRIFDNDKYDKARCLFVNNEKAWCCYRETMLLTGGLYSENYRADLKKSGKDKFYAMLDLNRCLILTSQSHIEKFSSSGSYFQNNLLEMCSIQPEKLLTEQVRLNRKRQMDLFEAQMKRNKLFDSGLSLIEERKALVFSVLQPIQQIRFLVYYHIQSVGQTPGNKGVILMKLEREDKYLEEYIKKKDEKQQDYVAQEELKHIRYMYHWNRLKKRKISHFVKEGFKCFQETVAKLIKSGVMNRLFAQFDFFSDLDRDALSPRSAHLRRQRQRPAKCGKRIDDFGDVKWDFEFARDQDEDSSDEKSSESELSGSASNQSFDEEPEFMGQKRSPVDDYELFLFGFFYFFVIQDPMINQTLNEPSNFVAQLNLSILQDLHVFNKQYLAQWVQIMTELDVFEPLGYIKPSLAFEYHVVKPYWKQLVKSYDWNLEDKSHKYKNKEAHQEASLQRCINLQNNVEKIVGDKYTIKNDLKEKGVKPMRPLNRMNLDFIKRNISQYVCTDCCSHKVVRCHLTAPGCVDVIEIECNAQSKDVDVPPAESKHQFFKVHSFVCTCNKKALICEVDRYSEHYMTNDMRPYEPDDFELERVHNNVIYRNLRLVQIKDCDDEQEQNKFVYIPQAVMPSKSKAVAPKNHLGYILPIHTNFKKNEPPSWIAESPFAVKPAESKMRMRIMNYEGNQEKDTDRSKTITPIRKDEKAKASLEKPPATADSLEYAVAQKIKKQSEKSRVDSQKTSQSVAANSVCEDEQSKVEEKVRTEDTSTLAQSTPVSVFEPTAITEQDAKLAVSTPASDKKSKKAARRKQKEKNKKVEPVLAVPEKEEESKLEKKPVTKEEIKEVKVAVEALLETSAFQSEEEDQPTEEDLEFEKELDEFRQKLEDASFLNMLMKQYKAYLKTKLADQLQTKEPGVEESYDMAQMSASKKRKIKKRAKQMAEQQKQKTEAQQLEDESKLDEIELPPEVRNYRKMRPNVSEQWLAKLRATLRKDPLFKSAVDK